MELHIEKLKIIRKRKKVTAEELAKRMGISRVTIGAWENAKRVPSEAKIRMLAKVLDISVDEISDLAPDKTISKINLAPLGSSISSVLSDNKEKNLNRQTNLVSGIIGIIKELSDAKLIIGAMLSSLPSLFYIKGSDLKYVTASEAFFKNLSLNKNYDVRGKTDYDFFPTNEAKINSDMDKQILADGKSILDKECYIPGSRKAKWGIMSKVPILDDEGKIEGVVGYFRDITERKKAEEKYNRLVNMSSSPICVTGMDGYFKFVNPAWENVLGYTSEELLAKPLLSFIHPDDHARHNAETARLAAGNPSMNFENRYIHKDGSIRYFLWTSTPIPNEKLIYCIARDITERKQVEEALRMHQVELEMQNEELQRAHVELDALRDRYFNFYESAPVGFFTLSKNGLILEANVTAAAMLGVDRSKLVKRSLTRFIHKADQDQYLSKRKMLLETGKQQVCDMRMLRADGFLFRAYLQTAPAQNGAFMIALSDITGLKTPE